MRLMRIAAGLSLSLFLISLVANAQEQTITVTGKLTRVMAIGGESTGWAIELDAETNVGGKQIHSIEVSSRDIDKLKQFDNKHVLASGKILHRQGVETGDRIILEVSSIQETKYSGAFSLIGSEWLLEDLAGAGVIDKAQATLAFSEEGKVAGKGSCNRFFGTAKITGGKIQFGPLGATRMACPEAIMDQETKYPVALQKADGFEWKDPYLLLHAKGFEKPLRFTRLIDKKK